MPHSPQVMGHRVARRAKSKPDPAPVAAPGPEPVMDTLLPRVAMEYQATARWYYWAARVDYRPEAAENYQHLGAQVSKIARRLMEIEP